MARITIFAAAVVATAAAAVLLMPLFSFTRGSIAAFRPTRPDDTSNSGQQAVDTRVSAAAGDPSEVPTPIGMPNCVTSCSGVDVPCPLGIGQDASYLPPLPGFNLISGGGARERLLHARRRPADGTFQVLDIPDAGYPFLQAQRSGDVYMDVEGHSNGLRHGGPYTLASWQMTVKSGHVIVASCMCTPLYEGIDTTEDHQSPRTEQDDENSMAMQRSGGIPYCRANIVTPGGQDDDDDKEVYNSSASNYDVQLRWLGRRNRGADMERLPLRVLVADNWFLLSPVYDDLLIQSDSCMRSRGGVEVEVPYPFRIGPSKCYWRGFGLVHGTHDPPRLLLGSGQFQVVSISLSNTMIRVIQTKDLPTMFPQPTIAELPGPGGFSFLLDGEVPYSLSTSSELVLTGCNADATLPWHGDPVDFSRSLRFLNATENNFNYGSYNVDAVLVTHSDPAIISGFASVLLLHNVGEHPDLCKSKQSHCYTCRCKQGYHGNPYVPDASKGTIRIIGVTIGAGLLLLALIAYFIYYKFKHSSTIFLKREYFKKNRRLLLQQLVPQKADIAEKMIINLEDLEKATNNFDKAHELGRGGHAIVYKGILSDLYVVAIKKPTMMVQREIDEFINEVAILTQINHRNIVKLYGCCLETEVPLLVYEFISNGTLYGHLHVEGPRSLPWNARLRIATEIAKALAYLHSAAIIPIIHRDVKPANILLDNTLTAKIADFGASRYISLDRSGLTTMVQGTIGYLDPMYLRTCRLTVESDVYSFGVMLIELMTRKKPFSYINSEGNGLVAHFSNLFAEGSLSQVLDPQVMDEGGNKIEEIAGIAVSCVKLRGEERPTMRQVEMRLEAAPPPEVFATISSSTRDGRSGDGLTSRQYSMEEEYMLSARYPR